MRLPPGRSKPTSSDYEQWRRLDDGRGTGWHCGPFRTDSIVYDEHADTYPPLVAIRTERDEERAENRRLRAENARLRAAIGMHREEMTVDDPVDTFDAATQVLWAVLDDGDDP